MKIATQLRIHTLLAAAMVLTVSLVFALAFQMQKDARVRAKAAVDLLAGAYELELFSNSYLRYPVERPREQWLLKYNVLVKSLDKTSFGRRGQAVFTTRMRQNLHNLKTLFDNLVETYTTSRSVSPEYRDRLAELLLVYSREISHDAVRLESANNAVIEDINRQMAVVLPIIVIIMVGITLWLSMRIGNSIRGPILKLKAGAETIGSGNLDYRIGIASDDEIGHLSVAFDQMTERLKDTTVSRDELRREVELRRQAEEEREKLLEGLFRSNKELEQFAHIASHDLQEPLRKIASFTELLAKRYKGKFDDKADTYIEYIVDGANRMKILINDLLGYSRVMSRGREFGEVDSNIVLRRVLETLDMTIKENGAEITSDPLPVVMADEIQLSQIFQNLISNAIKYRGEQSPKVHISVVKTEKEWTFSIRDNGIGIAPEFHERIFVIFQRLHTRAQYSGTGIGLAICHKIVERHGGRIWVESEAGKGATFYFTIPRIGGSS